MLSLIGSGCNRLSEIAGRMEKPATHLSGVTSFLIELKYIRREIPFGESLRSTKKTLYKIDDPFLNFWFTFVAPDKSRIDLGLTSQTIRDIKRKMPGYVSSAWEELCRQAVPFLFPDDNINPGMRWWGRGTDGSPIELDVVAESSDKRTLVIGEAKWGEKTDSETEAEILRRKIHNLPFAKSQRIIPVLFLKNHKPGQSGKVTTFGPEAVVSALR
jgi:AAA+ ATPase superfamily predicted ATPase